MVFKSRSVSKFVVQDGNEYDVNSYSFQKVKEGDKDLYDKFVLEAYEPLGFLDGKEEKFLPRDETDCFFLSYKGKVIGICSLTQVKTQASLFHQNIDSLVSDARSVSMLEINNVIFAKHLRGGIGVALLLYYASREVVNRGLDMLVGLTRYQTLRYFVEVGATPAHHEPLHLLGNDEIHDFIVYYDLRVSGSEEYLEQRIARFIYQLFVLDQIKTKIKKASKRRKHRRQPLNEERMNVNTA